MARGAKRFYAYQSRRADVPDEWCHVEHTRHATCGMPIDPERVLVVATTGQPWLDLWPWCETCRVFVHDPRNLTKGPTDGDPNPVRSEAADPEATDEAGPKA